MGGRLPGAPSPAPPPPHGTPGRTQDRLGPSLPTPPHPKGALTAATCGPGRPGVPAHDVASGHLLFLESFCFLFFVTNNTGGSVRLSHQTRHHETRLAWGVQGPSPPAAARALGPPRTCSAASRTRETAGSPGHAAPGPLEGSLGSSRRSKPTGCRRPGGRGRRAQAGAATPAAEVRGRPPRGRPHAWGPPPPRPQPRPWPAAREAPSAGSSLRSPVSSSGPSALLQKKATTLAARRSMAGRSLVRPASSRRRPPHVASTLPPPSANGVTTPAPAPWLCLFVELDQWSCRIGAFAGAPLTLANRVAPPHPPTSGTAPAPMSGRYWPMGSLIAVCGWPLATVNVPRRGAMWE